MTVESEGISPPNWKGDLISHPRAVVQAKSVDDIVAVLKDADKYPSPVRAIGSNHSTTRCGIADGGTVINMTGMNRIVEIGPDYVTADTSSLFSYSFGGRVMTIDPVSTGDPGWDDFLKAYNEFSSQNDGVPLFNQTKWITPEQAKKAFGDHLATFESFRKRFDPNDRLLNAYFKEVLNPA